MLPLEQSHCGVGRPDGERQLPSGTWPQKPSDSQPPEPGTNLSPVTGSILLRVSRSMMESNGTFRKNTLRRKNKPQGQPENSPAAPDSHPPDQGLHQPQKVSGLSGATCQRLRGPSSQRSPGKDAGGAPCCGSSRTPDSGRLPAPITPGRGVPGGHRQVSCRGADDQSSGRTVLSWGHSTS